MKGFTITESNTDTEHLNSYAAQVIERTLVDLATRQDKIVFGLCGGRSVGAIFELLSHKLDIPWKKVHFFMVDERLVPITSDDSNYKIGQDVLINPLKERGLISDENCHPFILDESTSDYGVFKYSSEINNFGGIFDLVLLSGGEDGHIAAIYPNHHSFQETGDFIYMTDSPKPPPERMTASKELILKTKVGILLVMGDSKADLFKRLSDDSVQPESCPAKLVTKLPMSYLITTHKD